METLVSDLTRLGLTDIEAKVYVTLLKKRNLSVKEISSAAKTNRTQTYDILAKLVEKGMCIEIFGNVKKYQAVKPEKVMKTIQTDLEKQKNIAENLASTLGIVFKNNDKSNDPLDFIKVFRTNKVIRDHVFDLTTRAQETICVFNKPPFAMNPDRNEPETVSIQKGVVNRTIYEIEDDIDSFLRKIKYFQSTGEMIRINEKLPLKLIIFDKRTVMMTLYNNLGQESTFTAMAIEQRDFASSMADIFDLYWGISYTPEDFLKQYKGES